MSGPRAPWHLYLRAAVFWVVFAVATILIGFWVGTAGWLFHADRRYRMARTWCVLQLYALRWLCGLRWRFEGLEHVPGEPVIFFSKHQSTWETLALVAFLPHHVHVLKRELFRVPFFGWGLAAVRPIGIDRGAGRVAVEQLVRQGRDQLAAGRCVMIFPEGTRVLPGRTERYRLGGAILAAQTATRVVPIAHNAGEFWPRHSFVKWPGTVDVIVGEPIAVEGKDPETINAEVRAWMDAQMARIEGRGPCAAAAESADAG